MAALTAAAARDEAQALRTRSRASRMQMRRLLRRSEQLQRQCEVTHRRLERARDAGYRSAWSGLLWRQPGADLDDVLVLL